MDGSRSLPKFVDLAEFVLKERAGAADWKEDSGEMLRLARAAMDERERETSVAAAARAGFDTIKGG